MRTLRLFAGALLVATALAVAPPAKGQNAEIAAARERANAAAAELSAAQSRAAELETEIARQEQALAEAEAGLAEVRSQMQALAVDAYIERAGGGTTFLVLTGDPNEQVRVDVLARLISAENADAVDAYRALAEDAATARAGLEAARAEQARVVEALEARRQRMAAELARLEELERQRIAEEQRRAAAAAAAAAARAAQSRGGGAGSSGGGGGGGRGSLPPVLVGNGNFLCPVQGPVAFIDSFGAPRSGGRRHQGVDMMAPRGTPTVAPVSGRVTHRGNSVGGLSWHLYGDDGNYYYGTHLSGYANEGAGHVAAGTVIGYVGDTGNARGTSPHLHFEIHPGGGAAINPYPTVRAAC